MTRAENGGSMRPVFPPAYEAAVESSLLAPVAIGDTGVDLLLLVSGFLITMRLSEEVHAGHGAVSFGRFVARRWLRLMPPYLAALAVHAAATPSACWAWGWTNIMFVNNMFGPQASQGSDDPDSPLAPCMGHAWSLAVEFQLYLVSPALVWAMWRLGRGGLVPWWAVPTFALAVSVALRSALWASAESFGALETSVYDKPYTRCGPYLVGMAVSWALRGHAQAGTTIMARELSGPPPPVPPGARSSGALGPGGCRAELDLVPACPEPALRDSKSGSRILLPVFWAGAAAWAALSWARAPFLLGAYLDQPGRSWAHGAAAVLFRPAFGLAVGAALLGMLAGSGEAGPARAAPSGAAVSLRSCWAAGPARLAGLLSLPAFVPIARLGYGVYLLQFVPIFLLDLGTRPEPDDSFGAVVTKWAVLCAATLTASLGLAAVLFVCVEGPCLAARDRLTVARGVRSS